MGSWKDKESSMKYSKRTDFLIVLSITCTVFCLLNTLAAEEQLTVEAGTELKVKLDHDIDIKKAIPGDEVTAYLIKKVKVGKAVALPKGTEVLGTIKDVSYQEGAVNESTIRMEFTKITLPDAKEKDVEVVVTEIGYSLLPQSPGTLFPEAQGTGTGAGGILSGGMDTMRESRGPSPDSVNIVMRDDGTLVAKGALIFLDSGTRITLILKKPLSLP